MAKRRSPKRKIRYAVVGMGHIAQVAVLPAFRHAARNSELTTLVSDDRTKRRELSRKYKLDQTFSYEEYDSCLEQVDAVYIALPNSMHAEYTIRAANAGVHVLCEKPMAVTSKDCERMIDACRTSSTAERLISSKCSRYAIISLTLFARQASIIRSQSFDVTAIGFSQST